MKFSDTALAQIADLRSSYRKKNRPEAARNLTAALRLAAKQITAGKSFPAPRSYHELATPGEAWTYAGRYWVAHTTTKPPVILPVFYDEADIPDGASCLFSVCPNHAAGNARLAAVMPGLVSVPLPAELTVEPAYGMVVLTDSLVAARFALFAMSEQGQAILARDGFVPD